MIHDIQQKILRLKKEKEAPQSTVIMCGVRFMAETVKILSPNKTVLLANPTADCPMAEQMDKELIEAVHKQYPNYTVVAYINTTAELKTICGGEEIHLDNETLQKARVCIDHMIELG